MNIKPEWSIYTSSLGSDWLMRNGESILNIDQVETRHREPILRALNSHESILWAAKTLDQMLSKGTNALEHSDLDAIRKARAIILDAEARP